MIANNSKISGDPIQTPQLSSTYPGYVAWKTIIPDVYVNYWGENRTCSPYMVPARPPMYIDVMVIPINIHNTANKRPGIRLGDLSPYPTVVILTNDHLKFSMELFLQGNHLFRMVDLFCTLYFFPFWEE